MCWQFFYRSTGTFLCCGRSLRFDAKNSIYIDMILSIWIFCTDRQRYIWTWIASNNINTQSHDLRRTYAIPWDLHTQSSWSRTCCIAPDSCQHASVFMSIFLLKSDVGTPQSIHFNVFVIVMCSIHRENNIWLVKSSVFWNPVPGTQDDEARMRAQARQFTIRCFALLKLSSCCLVAGDRCGLAWWLHRLQLSLHPQSKWDWK